MSQAQSISNMCNQLCLDYKANLNAINNSTKTLHFKDKTFVQQRGVPVPATVIDQLLEIGNYSACQAFLMENIKAKEALLKTAKTEMFESKEKMPDYPKVVQVDLIREVQEEWGWEQLSISELSEFWEAEARAAHIGQFIHRSGKLDVLRKELQSLPALEWRETGGRDSESCPIVVDIHHTWAQLSDLHNELANLHREAEQRVNYFKAKVKNLVTLENARIADENKEKQIEANLKNSQLLEQYHAEMDTYNQKVAVEQQAFERRRHETVKEIAALRIEVDPRFQKVIDELMPAEEEEK